MLSPFQTDRLILIQLFLFLKIGTTNVIRFCDTKGGQYSFTSPSCPLGIYFNPTSLGDTTLNGHMWNCICTTGAWFIYRKFCGTPQELPGRITQGDITCFNPQKYSEAEALGATYLGDSTESNGDDGPPIILTSEHSGNLLHAVAINGRTLSVKSGRWQGLAAIRLNPQGDYTVSEKSSEFKACLMAPVDVEPIGIFHYNLTNFYYSLAKSEIFNEFVFTFEKGCAEEGNISRRKKRDSEEWKSIEPHKLEDIFPLSREIIPGGMSNMTKECQRCYGTGMEISVDQIETGTTESCVKPDFNDIDSMNREIDLQSSRMGYYWAKKMLDVSDVSDGQFDYVRDDLQEIKILTKAAIIALGTCDMNYIPKEFYQYFLIMFKQLLSESFDKYAPPPMLSSENYQRIVLLLDKCRERTLPFVFQVSEACPAKYNSVLINGTKGTIEISQESRANPKKHDFLLEFIWKLKTFLHIHCFQDFAEESYLHDILLRLIEATFTDDLLIRWANPSLSKNMYDHIFRTTLDLDTTMYNFENCIKAVQLHSDFEVSLKRPIDKVLHEPHTLIGSGTWKETESNKMKSPESSNNEKSRFFEMFHGIAHCMKDFGVFLENTDTNISTCW